MTAASANGMTLSREAEIAKLRRLPRAALWVMAARPKTLSLSVSPVIAGTAIAAQRSNWRVDVFIFAILSAISIQIGANLWNDAADAVRGVDSRERLGPPRVTALGLLDGRTVRRAAILAYFLAALSGLYLIAIGGTSILAIGVLSLLMGYLYSMGPWPLSATPFGEILVILFFGAAAVGGTVFLHTGGVDGTTLWLGASLGLPAAAVLLLNNHRDRRTDAIAGRRTLAILIGVAGSRRLYAALLFGALAGLLCLAHIGNYAMAVLLVFAGLLTIQMSYMPVSAGLNRLLLRTALFQLAAVVALPVSALI